MLVRRITISDHDWPPESVDGDTIIALISVGNLSANFQGTGEGARHYRDSLDINHAPLLTIADNQLTPPRQVSAKWVVEDQGGLVDSQDVIVQIAIRFNDDAPSLSQRGIAFNLGVEGATNYSRWVRVVG